MHIGRLENAIFEYENKNESVTSDCPNINTTLKKVMNQTATILTYLDQVLLQLTYYSFPRFLPIYI